MNLIIDIGNSVSKYYVFDGDRICSYGRQGGHSLAFLPDLLQGRAEGWAEAFTPEAAIVCSVADLPEEAEARLQALPCPVVRFTSETPVPLLNRYHTPQTLGADRLAAAVGAYALCPGCPLLVIDAGSCITFDFVTPDGEYLGGNIAPGLRARLKAIDAFFPRLPKVEADGETPELGFDTETAIRAGVVQGLRREIEGYIAHFRRAYPELRTFLTGGDQPLLQTTDDVALTAEPHLLARGLAHVLTHLQQQTIQPQ